MTLSQDSRAFFIHITPSVQQNIGSYRVTFVDRRTNQLKLSRDIPVPPYTDISVETADLSEGDYTVTLYTLARDGAILGFSEYTVGFIPPAAMPTPAPSMTSTPERVNLNIEGITPDEAHQQFLVVVSLTGKAQVTSYQVTERDGNTNLQVKRNIVDAPPYDEFTVSNADLKPGPYQIDVAALDAQGHILARAAQEIKMAWTTGTPIATASDAANGLLIGLIGIIVIALIGVGGFLVYDVRKQAAAKTLGGHLPSDTNIDVSPPLGDETNVWQPLFDPEMTRGETAAIPGVLKVVETSNANFPLDKRIEIPADSYPFVVGRGDQCHVRIQDQRVSRQHVMITCDESGFQIKDVSKSGTVLNGKRVEGRQPLADGDLIKIGPIVTFEFRIAPDINHTIMQHWQ